MSIDFDRTLASLSTRRANLFPAQNRPRNNSEEERLILDWGGPRLSRTAQVRRILEILGMLQECRANPNDYRNVLNMISRLENPQDIVILTSFAGHGMLLNPNSQASQNFRTALRRLINNGRFPAH